MSWESFQKTIDKGPIHAIGAWWKIIVFTLLLAGLTGFGVWAITRPGALLEAADVRTNYEWFKQTHEDVKALVVQGSQVKAAMSQFNKDAGPRSSWHREDRTEYSRLGAVALGLQQQQAALVADYNARSRMVHRAIFKGTDTPVRLGVEEN